MFRFLYAVCVCVFCTSSAFATLPAGFTELEYIESTGTQWIDTGVSFAITDTSHITLDAIFYKGTSSMQYMGANGNNTIYIKPSENRGRANTAGYFTLKKRHIIETFTNFDTYRSSIIDGIKTVGTDSATLNDKYVLFALGDIRQYTVACRLYSVKINKNSNVVFDGIPAKDFSGNIGIYDTITKNFFVNGGTGDFIAGPEKIKIATTKMVDDEFAQAEANLAATVQTIESVVSRTIAQTGQIQILQDTKQTRPDENCPANMKCLLVQDEDGTPHWYPIIEP